MEWGAKRRQQQQPPASLSQSNQQRPSLLLDSGSYRRRRHIPKTLGKAGYLLSTGQLSARASPPLSHKLASIAAHPPLNHSPLFALAMGKLYLSRFIFAIKGSMASRQRRYDVMLRSIGRSDLTSKGSGKPLHARLIPYLRNSRCKRTKRSYWPAIRDQVSIERRHLACRSDSLPVGQNCLSSRCYSGHDQYSAG